jgi:cytidylate kinase
MINIAIDGTSASGKSSIANSLAKRLNYLHLNTGSLYRAYALKLLRQNITNPNLQDVLNLIDTTVVTVEYADNKQVTLLDGERVNELLEDNKVSAVASVISPYQELRDKVVALQRKLARENNIVIEGRDIATKIIPNAKYKFYITASDEVRAKRRFAQLVENGKNVTYEEILSALKERDIKDSTREHSPLVKADDAVLIDTSNINIEQSVDLILSYIYEKDK